MKVRLESKEKSLVYEDKKVRHAFLLRVECTKLKIEIERTLIKISACYSSSS